MRTQRTTLGRWRAALLVMTVVVFCWVWAWQASGGSNPVKVLGCTWERIGHDVSSETTSSGCREVEP